MPPPDHPTIAIVLPGGGARGAYEAGALSVLLPALEARGERATVVCGTSVGAINAALLGSIADRPAAEQAEVVLARWRDLRKGDVIAPVIGPNLPLTALRFLGDLLEVPGLRLASVMDPSPLRRSLARWMDWDDLHRNVRAGEMDAVCVVATSLARGGPTAFVERAPGRPVPRVSAGDALQYVGTRLDAEHVRASAAIPMLFPPVEVRTPESAAGAYVDGATRLNSPIAPALALGAERVVVIGFEPFDTSQPPPSPDGFRPRLADVAANVMDGLLVDQVVDDLKRLVSINAFYVGRDGMSSQAARRYRTAQGKPPYRKVAYALAAPERRGELAAIAEEVFQERYAGWRGLRSPDYPIISRLLGGGRTRARGELLSFLLFDEVYVERLIEHGAADAQRWLDRHPRFWCADAAHDFAVDTTHHDVAAEAERISEFRALRRR